MNGGMSGEVILPDKTFVANAATERQLRGVDVRRESVLSQRRRRQVSLVAIDATMRSRRSVETRMRIQVGFVSKVFGALRA